MNRNAHSTSDLGGALASLSESAGGLSTDLSKLTDAVDALEESTHRAGQGQQRTSDSLSKAATELGGHSPTWTAAGD